jgi:DNA adenine methylase
MYRVNLAGDFNVPKGSKDSIILDTDDFGRAASLLRRCKLSVSDFEPLIDSAAQDDLVFADPPYTVGHNNNGFVKYNERLFRWEDQVRLAKSLTRARKRGVRILATNAAHRDVAQLYRTMGFSIFEVERYSSISARADRRCNFKEIVIVANCEGELSCPQNNHLSKPFNRQPAFRGIPSRPLLSS